jgi:hypothetical protein
MRHPHPPRFPSLVWWRAALILLAAGVGVNCAAWAQAPATAPTAIASSQDLLQGSTRLPLAVRASVVAKALAEVERSQQRGTSTTVSFPLPTCVFEGGLCGALNRDGTVAVSPQFDWVDKFHEGRARVRSGGLYGYVDTAGRRVVEPQYAFAGVFWHGLAEVDVGGKSALIDLEGRQVLEPKFARAHAFTKDAFWVLEGTRRFDGQPGMAELVSHRDFNVTHDIAAAGKWGLVDRTGAWIRPLEFTAIMAVRTALGTADDSLTWARADGGWGLIKPDGTWLAALQFEEVGRVFGERTPVRLEGRWGYIDRTGTIVIAPQFDAAGSFAPNGLAPVKLGNRWGYVDAAGTIVIQPRFDHAYGFESNGFARARIDTLSGLLDRAGAWVIEPKYDKIYDWETRQGDAVWVEIGKQWGAFDRSGRLIVAPQFTQAHASICNDGWVMGQVDGKARIVRREGAPLPTVPEGELSGSSCQAPFRMRIGDRFGYVDRMLQPITDRKFEAAFLFSEGAAAVKLDGRFGYIKPDGTWLIEPRFEEAEPFFGGLAIVKSGGRFGYVKPDGTWQIEPRFEVARRFRDGFAIVRVDGRNGLIGPTGGWLVEPRWRQLGIALDSGLVAARTDEKWGFIDAGGAQVIGEQYDEFSYFQRGVAWVKGGSTWCAIDRRGRSVPTLECLNADPKPKPGTSTVRTRW